MRPLLGDFLAAASEHIDAATSDIPQRLTRRESRRAR